MPRAAIRLRRVRNGDTLSAALIAALALALAAGATELTFGDIGEPGAGFFPTILAVVLFGLAVAVLLRSWRAGDDRTAHFGPRLGELMATMFAVAVYGLLLEPVGYPVLTAVMLILGLRFLGRASWCLTLAVALGSTAAIYLLFLKLGVPLPAGPLSA